MGENLYSYINYIADPRARQALKGLFEKMIGQDPEGNLKLVLGTSAHPHTLAASLERVGVYSTSAATTGNIRQAVFNSVFTATATANQIENLTSIVTANVKTGAWCNAIFGKIDYQTSGLAHGLAGVICAELDLPGSTIVRGQYGCFEAELNVPTSCAGLTNPTSFMIMNAWGAAVANFRTSGYIFDISGLGTPDTSKIIQANTDQPTHALRIRVDGTNYYLLMTTVDNGTE